MTDPRNRKPRPTGTNGGSGAKTKTCARKFITPPPSAESKGDREWFRRNPNRSTMLRAASEWERHNLAGGATVAVLVYQRSPGVRLRLPVAPQGGTVADLLAAAEAIEQARGESFLDALLLEVLDAIRDGQPVRLKDMAARAILRHWPAGGTA